MSTKLKFYRTPEQPMAQRHHHKLDRETVLAIRARYKAGESMPKLGKACGVSHTAIFHWVHGKGKNRLPFAWISTSAVRAVERILL